jgi:transposase
LRLVSAKPTYEELAELAASQAELIEALRAQVAALTLEVAELRRQLGQDSTNSGQPSSKDSIAAKARRKAELSSRERSKDRKPGGQLGRKGVRLEPAERPDRTERAADPDECRRCGKGLEGARRLTEGWAQVWDVLPAVLERVHVELPRLKCSCGCVTSGSAPGVQAGAVVYGPNLNAYAVLLQAEGNVPVERAASLIEALLGVPVSTGFAATALARAARRLQKAGFEQAMARALRAEDVLCGDESPVNLLHKSQDEKGAERPGSPHAVVLRTPDTRLTWYGVIDARSTAELAALPPLQGFTGILVRDDYAGWHSYDPLLAGVQQCCAHLIRHLKGVLLLQERLEQAWAKKVIDVLRAANTAVREALAEDREALDPDLLARLRAEYDQRVAIGVSVNEERPWHDGNHPGYRIAARLRDKAEQVWLFARDFRVPWTNNPSEQALRTPKRHQAVSGYWHTPKTLAAYLRLRSYIVSAHAHGIRPLDALHMASNGRPWLPAPITP